MKIKIPQPCPADWEKMKIGAIGRHCLQCEKTVVDFSKMGREEMILYLLQNQSNSVCGRFRKSQLDFHHLEELITIQVLRNLPPKKAALLLSLACAVLASCQTPSPSASEASKVEINEPSDTSISAYAAKSIITEDSTQTIRAKKNAAIKDSVKDVREIGMIEMGEVIAEPYPWDTTVDPPIRIHDSIIAKSIPYTIVEHMPEFPGGMDSLFAFIAENFIFPATCAHYSGKIYVGFVVEKDGSLSNVEILRSPENFDALNKEAARVLNLMPNWTPGHNRGKPERVRMVLPINVKQD